MMSEKAVQDILHRIEQLSPDDRAILEERLAEFTQAQWKHEAQLARKAARAKGLDQAAIDQAIEELRYGK